MQFPHGLAAGDGGQFNVQVVARNGIGEPVLRGTAVAGVLRSAFLNFTKSEQQVSLLFGGILEHDSSDLRASHIRVYDSLLDTGAGSVSIRTHHLRNRHTKTVVDGGLFSLEACPPQTTTCIRLQIKDDPDSPELDITHFLDCLEQQFSTGVVFGGNTARGIGVGKLDGAILVKTYDLTDSNSYGEWLDDNLSEADPHSPPAGFTATNSTTDELDRTDLLVMHTALQIPRGQDILIADGMGLTRTMEPQRVRSANNEILWRIPGSSFRGMFKAWITRLAAREGLTVADSHDRYVAPDGASSELKGDNLGWAFLPFEDRNQETAETDCPVSRLFGTAFEAGRIQFLDAMVTSQLTDEEGNCEEEQLRKHVAIDPISGGAVDGAFFENTVLTSHCHKQNESFDLEIRVMSPSEDEVRWLCQALMALHTGVLRIGSSKAAGRLELARAPAAVGPHAQLIDKHFQPLS